MDVYSDREVYRKRVTAKDLVFYRVNMMETDLFIGSKTDLSQTILSAVKGFRQTLDEHIANNPEFHRSLIPVGYNNIEDDMMMRMCKAAEKADVGPMATVAGAFCQTAFEAVQDITQELIVENGGDTLVWSKRPRTIALYAGKSPLSMKLSLALENADPPLGVCASAGTFGHSLSYGKADLALCVSRDVLLADACATRLGNMIKTEADLKPAVEEIFSIKGILGAVAIIGDAMAAVGDIALRPIDNSL
ncbi:MAG: UPF0280 family protein [Eubacteriales bacterium]